MKKEETEKLDEKIMEYENMEKQLEVVLIQKHQLQLQLNELKHAAEELTKAKGDIYKSIGSLMILSNREESAKELKDRQELVEVKLTALGKQEEKLRASLTEAQKSLQERMKAYGKQG
jgi:prefoldin beta subunit